MSAWLPTGIVTGDQLDTMDDAALAYQAEHGAIFRPCVSGTEEPGNPRSEGARALVGYIGDGINDAPSLHNRGRPVFP